MNENENDNRESENPKTDKNEIVQKLTDFKYRETNLLGIDQAVTKGYLNSQYKLDFSPFLGRYFFIKADQFTTAMTRLQSLTLLSSVPGVIFNSNKQIAVLVNYGALYRMKMVLSISLAGTLTHSGCLLVALTPPKVSSVGPISLNSLMTSPHGFLYANEATSLELKVPWYCPSDYAPLYSAEQATINRPVDFTDLPNSQYGQLVAVVLNPLTSPSGSNTLQITIQAKFEELDIYVPSIRPGTWLVPGAETPVMEMRSEALVSGISTFLRGGKVVAHAAGDVFDTVSKALFKLTGLHNSNKPVINDRILVTARNYTNAVDVPQYFEKADPYCMTERITDDYIFGTTDDEMSMRYILAKEQYVGTFVVSTTDLVGTLLWSRPISPHQMPYDKVICNNISLMYILSRAWNGDFEIVFRSSATNKQQFKLAVARFYHPPLRALGEYPSFPDVVNTLTQVIEFTAGGQEQVVLMPYLGRLEVTPISPDPNIQAMLHGLYYVYVAQTLTVGDDSPLTAEVNVFIRSKTLNFYGYATETVGKFDVPLRSESGQYVSTSDMKVMNAPQQQEDIQADESYNNLSNRIHPIVNVRDYVRRMYKFGVLSYNPPPEDIYGEIVIPLSMIVGGQSPVDLFGSSYTVTPVMLVSSMYYGKQIGFKLKFVFSDALNNGEGLSDMQYEAYFVPPAPYITSSSNVVNGCNLSSERMNLFPFPIIDGPLAVTAANKRILECVVPNVSPLKFMTSVVELAPEPSNMFSYDYGHIVLVFRHKAGLPNITVSMFVGLSDESRLGFHTIAPTVSCVTDQDDYVLSKYQGITPFPVAAGKAVFYQKPL